ncbi:Signal transduction histidine kinase [Eubacterium aggregans]|uniref:Heme sensor protein HssS n=1 Tax=Eubacterium aggregans TaxID=81409 RepID=A0A1H3YDV3_9FIRM|nr:HAMP domain-containing sensor histidine kinase [Eubacterium aggregans]SEA09767.1 Signal transduction histidine kinase [Eubacterium aggregans]
MNKPSNRLQQQYLALFFASIIFVIMLFTMSFIFLIFIFLSSRGWFDVIVPLSPLMPVFIFGLISIFTGTLIAGFFSRIPLAPIREIISAVDHLADGDFNTRLNLKGPGELQNLNQSFNHMAEELGSIEVLRTDFTNNFSHEFKTPIVSIRGFARILKYEDLTPEERSDYLDIIIKESDRLVELSTNVLNLSKVENQSILSDKSTYNLSEQLRRVVALLEQKWTEKNLEIDFDSPEIGINAGEELLKQVWINLLDNAIKFSPFGGKITIHIEKAPGHLIITFSDEGQGIEGASMDRIFEKFYQGDSSHATKGNGLGLTLSKKIVELHSGAITVEPNIPVGTTLIVKLPAV